MASGLGVGEASFRVVADQVREVLTHLKKTTAIFSVFSIPVVSVFPVVLVPSLSW